MSCIYFSDGKRQIVDFHLPGEVVGFRADPMVQRYALSDLQLASFTEILDGVQGSALSREVERADKAASHRLAMRVASIGRQRAPARMASLILDWYRRLDHVGLANGRRFTVPATQYNVGDATGLSSVHVNRVLQKLRAERVILWEGKEIEILNLAALSKIAAGT